MRPVFNSAKPYTETFGPDAEAMKYYQNDLYFHAKGHLVDCAHNREQAKKHRVNYEFGPLPEQALLDAPADGARDEMSDEELRLRAASPMDVYSKACIIRDKLDNDPDVISEDEFQPEPDEVDANIAFILKHTQE